MAFFPMWPPCCVIFLLIQSGVVTAADGACTRLDDEANGTRISCDWQNNLCDPKSDSKSRDMIKSFFPDWECFAVCASGPWSMIYSRSKTVTLKSPWLCPTGLDVYNLTLHFQAPQDRLPEHLQLFVLKETESNEQALQSSQATFSLSTGTWFANYLVFCLDCKFQIIFRTSLPGNVSLHNISLDFTGPRPPDIPTTDKFYAMWIAGIVILLVVAVVAVACFIFWWRKKERACGAEGAGGDEGTTKLADLGETDSGMGSGGSVATAGTAVSGNGSAGSAQQQAKNKGDNPPRLQRDGAMPSPSHSISATPKPSPVSEENRYSAPDDENYDHRYYAMDERPKYDDQGYLEPIADPHAKPEPVVTSENLYDEPKDESPPLPYRPPGLRRK